MSERKRIQAARVDVSRVVAAAFSDESSEHEEEEEEIVIEDSGESEPEVTMSPAKKPVGSSQKAKKIEKKQTTKPKAPIDKKTAKLQSKQAKRERIEYEMQHIHDRE